MPHPDGRILVAMARQTAPSAAVPPTGPAAPIVAADLEGTCTSGETWRGVGRWLAANGRGGRYRRFLAPRLAVLPLVRIGLVGRQAFRDRWIRDLARLLDGLTPSELAALAEEVVEEELWPKRRTSVLDELEAAATSGRRVVIASGTYQRSSPPSRPPGRRAGRHDRRPGDRPRDAGRTQHRSPGRSHRHRRAQGRRVRALAAGAPIEVPSATRWPMPPSSRHPRRRWQ